MINVLPPDIKENIAYARRNTRLRKWIIALGASIFAVVALAGAGQIYMQQAITTYQTQVKQGTSELEAQNLSETQAKVTTITNNLKLVVQVLSREVLFSKLLRQIGTALPNGSVLTDLRISDVQGGIDLQASAVDYQTATQVQVNLQDPNNKIFEKADILNVQCTQPTAGTRIDYPCTVQVRALFAKNNPFSFVNASEAKP